MGEKKSKNQKTPIFSSSGVYIGMILIDNNEINECQDKFKGSFNCHIFSVLLSAKKKIYLCLRGSSASWTVLQRQKIKLCQKSHHVPDMDNERNAILKAYIFLLLQGVVLKTFLSSHLFLFLMYESNLHVSLGSH